MNTFPEMYNLSDESWTRKIWTDWLLARAESSNQKPLHKQSPGLPSFSGKPTKLKTELMSSLLNS